MKSFKDFVLNETITAHTYNNKTNEITMFDGDADYQIKLKDGRLQSLKGLKPIEIIDPLEIYKILSQIVSKVGKACDYQIWKAIVTHLLPTDADKLLKTCAAESLTCKKFKDSDSTMASLEKSKAFEVLLVWQKTSYIIDSNHKLVRITDNQNWEKV